MITSISIENFKGIRDRVDLTFKPITLLFGANSAGKSTVLQALHYAGEVLRNHNLDADRTATGGDCIRLGGFRQFVHNHEVRRPLVLKIGLQFPHFLSFADYYRESENEWDEDSMFLELSPRTAGVELTIRWYAQLGRPFVTAYRLELDGVHAGTIECNPERKEVWIRELNDQHPLFLIPGRTEDDADDSAAWRLALSLPIALAGARDALPKTGAPLSFGAGALDGPRYRDEAEQRRREAVFSKIFLAPLECLVWDLSRFRFVGAMRALPPFGWQDSEGNEANWADGSAAWRHLVSCDETFLDTINGWLAARDKLDTGYRVRRRKVALIDQASPLWLDLTSGRAFDETEDLAHHLKGLPTATGIVLVDEKRGGLEVAPHDVGIGVSQLVPMLVACLDRVAGTDLARTVAIDTPELHLHPRQVAALGDLFIDAGLGENKHGVILETHSEHLILRLQRRIREHAKGLASTSPPITGNDVAVYHVAQQDGQTMVNRIDLDQNGDFVQPWPDDFFEIDFYERFGHAD